MYIPSAHESADPRVFAANVRAVMADALGVATVDKRLDDARGATYGSSSSKDVNGNEEKEPKTVSSYIDFAGNLGLMA